MTMDRNTWEFDGIITGFDSETVRNGLGNPVRIVNPEVTVDVPGLADVFCMRPTHDVDEARGLVGRRVRVTVEVLDR